MINRFIKTISIVCSMMGFCFLSASANGESLTSEKVYLSGKGPSTAVEWDFFCSHGQNSGKWTKISVPSNWEQEGFGGYNYGSEPLDEKLDETGTYKTRFTALEEWKGKHIQIVFEGSMTETSVKLNGKSLGFPNIGGYIPFSYKLNDYLKYGEENELEVHVLKKPNNLSVDEAERNADYWVFGGIYRPVYLEIQEMEFVRRVAIDARADGNFRMDVFPQVHHKTKFKTDIGIHVDEVVAQIRTLDGKAIGEEMSAPTHGASGRIRFSTSIDNAATWSPETPSLYEVHVTLKLDGKAVSKKIEKFGFRTFELKPNDGLYLNGQKIRIRGINRNVFDAQTARCIDDEKAWQEAREIKAMNANLVRSHLPPTTAFMEACDELGLLVITELSNWHDPYIDTPLARNIAYELVIKYQNYPSVILWANGNEGGFNLDVDDLYHLVDLQDRPVIHPWTSFEGIDTYHYPKYGVLAKKLEKDVVTLPTEFLHGLYDGGHGAGIEDYWKLITGSKVGAGGILWCWADAAIARSDMDGKLDTFGNKSADGIVGPNGEKEASYYTVRAVWSPIQISTTELPANFSGKLPVENLYYETNLSDCTFTSKLVNYSDPYSPKAETNVSSEVSVNGPNVEPGKSGTLDLDIKSKLKSHDALELTAYDPDGLEIMNWSWAINQPSVTESTKTAAIKTVNDNPYEVKVGNVTWSFSPKTGQLLSSSVDGKDAGIGKGPVLYAGTLKKELQFDQSWKTTASKKGDHYLIESRNDTGSSFSWKITKDGLLNLEYDFNPIDETLAYCAVGFDLPEDKVLNKRWLGNGPFRVWSNRLKGPTFGLWENEYNDFQTGIDWGKPEFKGIFNNIDWMKFDLKSGASLLVDTNSNSPLGVLNPKNPPKGKVTESASVNAWWHYPTGGGLHFFHKLPGVGTKFQTAEYLGPQGQPAVIEGNISGGATFQVK